MNQYKDIINCILGKFIQYFGSLKTFDMGNVHAYQIPSEGVAILLIKLYFLLEILGCIVSILVFGGMSFSMGIKYLQHPDDFFVFLVRHLSKFHLVILRLPLYLLY